MLRLFRKVVTDRISPRSLFRFLSGRWQYICQDAKKKRCLLLIVLFVKRKHLPVSGFDKHNVTSLLCGAILPLKTEGIVSQREIE